MNKIDKLLIMTRASRKYTYLLVTTRIPLNDKFNVKISLQKGGDLVAHGDKIFNTPQEIDAYMDELCKKYNLTENNTEFTDFVIVPATKEMAEEYNDCEAI